ncbi:hypothetical protein LCGC14_0881400 [marine sediment metagenome]|uniref:N-acetyltransferase domain-containing protein n=1 Tax=marine sediment metagenome TaxID=412755 RepID=A0A0F9RLD4_9ZZZZ
MIPQRQCIFLKGDTEWCHSSVNTLLADFEQQNTLYLSQQITPDSGYKTIPQKQAQQQLGKEFDAVVFDATEEFNPDSFGAIVGTVKAGGALIVLLSSNASESLWLKRFRHIANEFCTEYDCFFSIEQGDELPTLMALQTKPSSQEVLATADQSTAIEAILKVVSGHRRRPLVLSSDRGRGKSAVLGMAAAELIKQGKQSIIVTAPSLATVASLFEYAGRLLPEAKVSNSDIELDGAQIRFIAPDALLESDIKADLVLVDEAAAIPAAMLEQLLKKFSRIAFASTIHGYEGTGLGFAIRFKHTLDDTTPNWRSVKMTQPIRWAENDALEAFSFKALLLDAEPARDELLAAANVDNVAIEVITAQQLLADERLLAEVFGLMVMAHYRTRPSDLQMMLDRDDMTIVVMRYQHHVVASAWCIAEPALSPALAQQVYDGERRLKGQLCPQSLLVHAGLLDAGRYHYQRISRIAVHPAYQRRGLGRLMLEKLPSLIPDSDIIGTSFAMTHDVFEFWSASSFKAVRLGQQNDEVSGSISLMMLRAVSDAGQSFLSRATNTLRAQWSFLLAQQLNTLPAEDVVAITQQIMMQEIEAIPLAEIEKQVFSFAYKQRPYESSAWALNTWLYHHLVRTDLSQLSSSQQQLLMQLILQKKSIETVASSMNLAGRKAVINQLRDVFSTLLEQAR